MGWDWHTSGTPPMILNRSANAETTECAILDLRELTRKTTSCAGSKASTLEPGTDGTNAAPMAGRNPRSCYRGSTRRSLRSLRASS